MASVLRTKISKLRSVMEGRSPYARAYARHSSGDPQEDGIAADYAKDEYEELLAEMPGFLRASLANPDETSEVDSKGVSGNLSKTVFLKDLPELHLPPDNDLSVTLVADVRGEEDADEAGYSWSRSIEVGYLFDTTDVSFDAQDEPRKVLTKMRADLRKFLAIVKRQVPEQYHNKLK